VLTSHQPEYESSDTDTDTDTDGNSNALPLIKMTEEEVEAIRVDYRYIRLPGFSHDPQKLVGGVSYSTESRTIRITRKELRKLKRIRAKTPAGSSSLDRYDNMPKGPSKGLARNLARDVVKAKAKLAREQEQQTKV
jgi:hypothetical protein